MTDSGEPICDAGGDEVARTRLRPSVDVFSEEFETHRVVVGLVGVFLIVMLPLVLLLWASGS